MNSNLKYETSDESETLSTKLQNLVPQNSIKVAIQPLNLCIFHKYFMIQKISQIQKILQNQIHHLAERAETAQVQKNTKKHPVSVGQKSKQDIQVENKVLFYELAIYRKVLSVLSIDEASKQFKHCQKMIDDDIKAAKINELSSVVHQKQRKLKATEEEKLKLIDESRKVNKKLQTLQRKVSRYEGQGGTVKLEKMSNEIKTLKNDKTILEEQNKTLKTKNQQLIKKVKILNELNAKTQNQLAEVLTEIQQLKGNRQKSQLKQMKMELLSTKQKNKNLKKEIGELERQKDVLKKIHEDKEILYSKMIVHGCS